MPVSESLIEQSSGIWICARIYAREFARPQLPIASANMFALNDGGDNTFE
jgi:hypothetical protein